MGAAAAACVVAGALVLVLVVCAIYGDSEVAVPSGSSEDQTRTKKPPRMRLHDE